LVRIDRIYPVNSLCTLSLALTMDALVTIATLATPVSNQINIPVHEQQRAMQSACGRFADKLLPGILMAIQTIATIIADQSTTPRQKRRLATRCYADHKRFIRQLVEQTTDEIKTIGAQSLDQLTSTRVTIYTDYVTKLANVQHALYKEYISRIWPDQRDQSDYPTQQSSQTVALERVIGLANQSIMWFKDYTQSHIDAIAQLITQLTGSHDIATIYAISMQNLDATYTPVAINIFASTEAEMMRLASYETNQTSKTLIGNYTAYVYSVMRTMHMELLESICVRLNLRSLYVPMPMSLPM